MKCVTYTLKVYTSVGNSGVWAVLQALVDEVYTYTLQDTKKTALREAKKGAAMQQEYRKVIQVFSDLSHPPSQLVETYEWVGNARPRLEKTPVVEYFLYGSWRRRRDDERDENNHYWWRRTMVDDPKWHARLVKDSAGRK